MRCLKILNKIIGERLNNEKGIVLPVVAGMVVIFVLLGSVNLSLLLMYRDRAMVRNALDAGLASALAAHTQEVQVHLNYGERRDPISTNSYITSRSVLCGYTSDDPPSPIYGTSCVYRTENKEYLWSNTKSTLKNYIHLPIAEADSTALDYFQENIDMNANRGARIVDWEFNVRYDDQRMYQVYKSRSRMNEPRTLQTLIMGTTSCSSSLCGSGGGSSPKVNQAGIYNEVTNAHEDFGSWWNTSSRGFVGADTGSWGGASGFSNSPVETINDVLFPRWVQVTANSTVEMPLPFGSWIGRETYEVSFSITAMKELVNVIP